VSLMADVFQRSFSRSGRGTRSDNKEFMDLFVDILREIGITDVVEVGAHDATFSSTVVERLTGARVVAFEANPYVYDIYKKTMRPDVEYRNEAVSDSVGEKTLFVPIRLSAKVGTRDLPMGNTTASLSRRVDPNAVETEVTVPAITLDLLIQTMTKGGERVRAAAWIDVEGAIAGVFEGGKEALSTSIEAIYVEVEEQRAWLGQWLASDVDSHLSSYGFECVARDCETSWQHNRIYLKKSSINSNVRRVMIEFLERLWDHDKGV
jgi:FkbM family methyltransferase